VKVGIQARDDIELISKVEGNKIVTIIKETKYKIIFL